jgi:uncharacterized protein (TIGR00288 family)
MTENISRARNVALLIDADNASPDSLDPVLTVLAELGTVNIRRAYGNWQKSALGGWANMVHRHAIEPQQQFDVTKGKSATDMKMTIDAMDLLYRRHVQAFGIMSSDSDFMPLAMRIRQDGLEVYGFGESKTPDSFQAACTRFIFVESLTSAGVKAPIGATQQKRPVDQSVLKLLEDAIDASALDDRDFARLSEVGSRAGNRSSFDTRSYGYNRLSDMVSAIERFEVERREDGVYVRRAP